MEPYTFDLQRIFLGDLPLLFLVEILFRTVVLFTFALIMLRLVGHRELGQLSTVEFTLIIALGSAVGDPMFYADVPLLHGMLVIALVVGFQRVLIALTMRYKPLEHSLEGQSHRLVIDGFIDLEGLKHARVSRRELFSELRKAGAENLGQVRRAYLELDGEVSTFMFNPEAYRPGLPLLESAEENLPDSFLAADVLVEPGTYVCFHCGYAASVIRAQTLGTCPHCGRHQWVCYEATPGLSQLTYLDIADQAQP